MKKIVFTFALIVSALAPISCANKSNAEATQDISSGHGIVYLDKAQFIEKIFDFEKSKVWNYKGDVPAIIDFYADWCGPCRQLSPVLEKIQAEYKGKIQIYKVNTDKQRELAGAFGVKSLPTIVFIPQTGQPQAVMGFRPQADLEKIITEVLKVSK